MTTIAQLARDTHAQPYEIAAYLDLGTDWTDHTELADDLAAIWHDSEDGIYTPGAATALAQLNAYDGDNIWQDLILTADWYDDDATDAIDAGTNDRLVTTTGGQIEYDHQAREWVRA